MTSSSYLHLGEPLDAMLRAAARAHRDRTALLAGNIAMTYGELLARSERLGGELAAHGARPDTFVGVTVDRSIESVVGILGVLSSGAAYIPLDPEAPRARLRRILEQAEVRLATGPSCDDLAGELELRTVSVPSSGEAADFPIPTSAAPENAIYAIFTSGSTGSPKGVVVSHAAVVHSTLARFAVFPSQNMTYLMLAPFTFNAAVAGLFFTLSAGGTLVIPTPEEARDPSLLAGLVVRHAVTHLDAVPSQYAAILEFEAPALASLKCVVVAGELLSQGLVRRHAEALPNTPLFNEYGATETTVWSTVHRCNPDDPGPFAPIGRAIDGVEVDIVDSNLEPVARGEIGEIAVSGRQLARGYLGQPELTAERFVRHPTKAGERMYLTGDLGRVHEDGYLVHCGRIGSMVKIRGYRVEIGEIEGHLRAQPDVVNAVVLPERFAGTTRLVAVVVRSSRVEPHLPALRERLAEHLPPYMIPSVWREIDRMPITANGKIDRDAAARLVKVARADVQHASND